MGTVEEGRWLGTVRNSRGLISHPASSGWRHHPTGGWGSCNLLIITLLPGLSVCLSFQLSVSLANQRRSFQESWKRRRNVSLGRGFLWKVWKNCGISTCVKVCLARGTFSFQSCCKDVNHEPVTLLAERKLIPLRRGAGSGSAVSLGRKRQTFILETSLGTSHQCCREPGSGWILPVSCVFPSRGASSTFPKGFPTPCGGIASLHTQAKGFMVPFACPPQPQPTSLHFRGQDIPYPSGLSQQTCAATQLRQPAASWSYPRDLSDTQRENGAWVGELIESGCFLPMRETRGIRKPL